MRKLIESTHGYQLRARLDEALGPLGEGLNAGHIYVTLGRLERAGLVAREGSGEPSQRQDRKVYHLTPAGQERLSEWLSEVDWPRPDLAEFHLSSSPQLKDAWATRLPSSTPSDASCSAGCGMSSGLPWTNRADPTRPCCLRG
jgi:DNA-binding PadR family transcriptional regulator